MRRYEVVFPVLAVFLPLFLFALFKKGYVVDPLFILPEGHFRMVSFIAILAALFALAVGVSANRLRNIQVTFLSLSSISLAQMFALHGLSTPGFLIAPSHLPGISAQLSIVFATFWLYLSSIPSDHRLIVKFARFQRFLVPGWIVMLSVVSALGLFHTHLADFIPINVAPVNWILTVVTIGLNLITLNRYFSSYRFSRFPLQMAIVYSAGWMMIAQLIMVLGETWRLSWWIYHFLLLCSIISMLIGLYLQYAAKGTMTHALYSLFTSDPFARISGSISPSVKALIVATEKKDAYTAGHTFRVTLYAIKLGEEMKLKPEQLRALAQGGLLHDVGKISIPDHVLNKQGKLSSEEREEIETHPGKGYEMCRNLGFMKEELQIIRHHHEKWDGTGYPDQLAGESIPLLARIMAVADVYDALTSERSYRKAWKHEEAIEYLQAHKESHFDPECVNGWIRLCNRRPDVYLYPSTSITDQTAASLLSSF